MAAAGKSKARKAKAIEPAPVTEIVAYKGFDRDLRCRGFQFEIGRRFEHKGRVAACASGFHSCENPLDVWSYYPLGTSRFAVVRASGQIARHGEDSKIASATLHIEAELALPEFIKRAVEWVLSVAKGNTATGYRGHAAATGDSGHAAATGDRGHAAAKGKSAIAAALGPYSTATAGEAGAIMLAHYDTDVFPCRLTKVGAFMVGEHGVEAGKTYRLTADGRPEVVNN
jgi:hypothetical protein